MTNKKINIKRIELTSTVDLFIPKEVRNQIDFLHNRIGNKEWSGVLVYERTHGSMSSLKDLKFKVLGIYPMDIGSHSYTEFEYGAIVANIYELFPDKMEIIKIGLIHSHHNMSAFFSGTDLDELLENTTQQSSYLSLIVNFSVEYVAKLAVASRTAVTRELNVKDESGNPIIWKMPNYQEEEIVTININIIHEEASGMPTWFEKQYEDIKSKPASHTTKNNTSYLKRGSETQTDSPISRYNSWWDANHSINSNSKEATKKKETKFLPMKSTKVNPMVEDEFKDQESSFYGVAAIDICSSILNIRLRSLTSGLKLLTTRPSCDTMTEAKSIEWYKTIFTCIKKELLDYTTHEESDFMLSSICGEILGIINFAQDVYDIPEQGLLTDFKFALESYETQSIPAL